MNAALFGSNFKKLIALHGITGAEAAQVLETTPQSVSAWVQGRRPPHSQAMFAIREVFGLDPTRLALEDTEALLPTLADQQRYHETQARLKKLLRHMKAVG